MIFKHSEILSISVVCRLVGQRKGIDYASAVMSIDILFSSFLLFVIELERPRESYIRNSPISVARQLRQESRSVFPHPLGYLMEGESPAFASLCSSASPAMLLASLYDTVTEL